MLETYEVVQICFAIIIICVQYLYQTMKLKLILYPKYLIKVGARNLIHLVKDVCRYHISICKMMYLMNSPSY